MTLNKIIDILSAYAEEHVHYFSLYYGYAEPGYSDPESGIIALGNWNSNTRYNRETNQNETIDNIMPRIAAILEHYGIELEWEDEWVSCDDCGKLVRTQPNSYSWTRSYWMPDDCSIQCQDCMLDDPTDYLEYLEGNSDAANTLDIDLDDAGYSEVELKFANGWYEGQNDDPHTIATSLHKMGIERFVFDINNVGQFGMSFSVYVHKSEYNKLNVYKIKS